MPGADNTMLQEHNILWLDCTTIKRNPHHEPALKALTGLDPAVRDFVLADDVARQLLLQVRDFMCLSLQHTAIHCNTLQHTATYCNTLQRTATRSYLTCICAYDSSICALFI